MAPHSTIITQYFIVPPLRLRRQLHDLHFGATILDPQQSHARLQIESPSTRRAGIHAQLFSNESNELPVRVPIDHNVR